jgi:radical SAM superfamily enzyme YgiQ (UPF0313 family)
VNRRPALFSVWAGARLYPLRLAYLAAELQASGATVGFLDCPRKGYDRHAAAGAVFGFHADVIYCELDSREARAQLRFLARVKELSATRIVLGGAYATVAAEPILTRFHAIDAVVCGEPDLTLLDMVAHWHEGLGIARLPGVVCRSVKKLVEGPPRPLAANLDDLPFPDREIVPFREYQAGWLHHRPVALIAGTRGCPRACRFCRRGGEGETVRFRSTGNVVLEVEELVRHHRVRELRFVDAAFNADPAWSLALAEALVPCEVTWHCTVVAHTLTTEHLRAYRRAGCRDLFLTPVCPTEEEARKLGSGDGPEAVKAVLAMAAAEDVRVHVRVIAGQGELPDPQRAQEFASSLSGCSVAVRQLHPQVGSPLVPEVPRNLFRPEEGQDLRPPLRFSLGSVRVLRERMHRLLRRSGTELCAEVGPERLN